MMKKTLVAMLGAAVLLSCGNRNSDPIGIACTINGYHIERVPPGSEPLVPDQTIALIVSRTPACLLTWPVSWRVTPPQIATIRATGDSTAVLRALQPGTASITVQSVRGGGLSGVVVRAP